MCQQGIMLQQKLIWKSFNAEKLTRWQKCYKKDVSSFWSKENEVEGSLVPRVGVGQRRMRLPVLFPALSPNLVCQGIKRVDAMLAVVGDVVTRRWLKFGRVFWIQKMKCCFFFIHIWRTNCRDDRVQWEAHLSQLGYHCSKLKRLQSNILLSMGFKIW